MMAANTNTTIEDRGITRLLSPTPSESSSVYFDLVEEIKVSPGPKSKVLAVLSATDAKQSLITSQPITPPSTPLTWATASNKVEGSPSSSDTSATSRSNSFNSEPESPITQRTRSPSSTPHSELEDGKLENLKLAAAKIPCLQCHLAGLSCSLIAKYATPPQPNSTVCCTRCAQSGEIFCIIQVAVEMEGYAQLLRQPITRKLEMRVHGEYMYYAGSVEPEVVMERAEELLEAMRVKTRFALPKYNVWKKRRLNRVFGGWPHWQEMVDDSDGLEDYEWE